MGILGVLKLGGLIGVVAFIIFGFRQGLKVKSGGGGRDSSYGGGGGDSGGGGGGGGGGGDHGGSH